MVDNEPKVIKRLDPIVVNRIAAGEVIQRPANALKEMIENSIDAKSTTISITVNAGGLKYLQIQDNGTGIRKEDLGIVCERFTTSKLQNFEDLNSISTYGFRGEALASISHVAHLTIQTKTRNAKCAFKAAYCDGKLKDKPTACAGHQGTQITVEDLFYNISSRKNALKNHSEEYQRIFDVVSKYAIHNAQIGFSLKKVGEKNDFRTPMNSNHVDNIRRVYGNNIAKELLDIDYTDSDLKFTLKGYFTNLNFSTKKTAFLLFINHRLVDSLALRKAIDAMFSMYLPKGTHPFVYLSLEIDSNICDVNVHPTKHEVHFLHEEVIVDKIKSQIEEKLMASKTSRIFYTQVRLPGASEPENIESKDTNVNKTIHDKNLVRTDANEQKLEQFFGESKKIQSINSEPVSLKSVPRNDSSLMSQRVKKNKIQVKLTSVLELQKKIRRNCDPTLREIFAQHKFVGCIDLQQSLIQHDTKLYLCDTVKVCEELFYQFIIYDFQNFDQIRFEAPLPIYDQVITGLEFNVLNYDSETNESRPEIAEMVKKLLIAKRDMLNTYFALEIDAKGNLLAIPLLLDQYTPDFTNLPLYLIRLATEVNWEDEQECFDNFARETAMFYSNVWNDGVSSGTWILEHILYPTMKSYLLPPKVFGVNGRLLLVANLPDLYRVFERC